MSNQKKHDEEKSGVIATVATVTVAVVVVGIAVAGALAFKDKKNRDKAKELLTRVQDQAVGYANGIQKKVQDKTEAVEKKVY